MAAPVHVRAFTDARRVSAPFVVVRTPDQFQSRAECFAAALTIKDARIPAEPLLLAWDIARGLTAPHNGQHVVLDGLLKQAGMKQGATCDLTEAVLFISGTHRVKVGTNASTREDVYEDRPNTPVGTIAMLHNAQRQWDQAPVAQAMANCRDEFKRSFKMLCSLTTMAAKPPEEIRHDCIVLDVALPTEDSLRDIVAKTVASVGGSTTDDVIDRATNGVRGLGAFVAETAVAMSLRKSGVNFDALLEQRIAAIQQVEGVEVYRGRETFADVVGLDGVKRAWARLKTAKRRVRVVVIFDEFEKSSAGSQAEGGDSTGVAQRQNGHLLSWMSAKKVRGSISFGHPGTGKTFLAKALANELGCICLTVDLAKALGQYVGQSEHNLRAITDLIDALAGDGGAFIVATCNSMTVLTTEMRRRFNRGLFFFDLPNTVERDAAWTFYCNRYGIGAKTKRPHDEGWTPAEIAVCCEQADDYDVPLVEAAENVVPVALSQPEVIEQRRKDAHQRLLDAGTGRAYRMPGSVTTSSTVDAVMGRAIAEMPES